MVHRPARPRHEFESLSLKDLLEARDLYHFHLIDKANVIGTAVGLYLIRKDDPYPGEEPAKRKRRGPRTLTGSEVREYSWPCVIVLVRRWIEESKFSVRSKRHHPREMVPDTLFMPDGRKVPVCVVVVEPAEAGPAPIPTWHWPTTAIGPGYPLSVDTQGSERIASIGCLVTDGHTTYALTNRHVSGAPGSEVYTYCGGNRIRIGKTCEKQLTRLPFSTVYPEFPGRRTYVNLDVGLVEIDDLTWWTSRVYGIGAVGELKDLHEANIRLDLINTEVVAHGAASGPLRGRIAALFYRYKSVAGYDYVTDFLIAPLDFAHQTRAGDSGTVWHHVPADGKGLGQPIAIEWGGQALREAGVSSKLQLALATSLSSVLHQLDVELVRTGSTDAQPYWGQVGHYSIGTFACAAVRTPKLEKLMNANKDRVSFVEGDLDPKIIKEAMKRAQEDDFIPLADVPDIVWKKTPYQMTGGRDRPAGHRSTGPEHPVHYADIDEKGPGGKTLMQLCLDDEANLAVDVWQRFYDAKGHTKQSDRGLLPFRVWQIFDEMVEAAREKKVDRFVCAAGILSHYVGDACQPLHGSIYADGFKDQKFEREVHHNDGTTSMQEVWVGKDVHSAFETAMIDKFAGELVHKLKSLADASAGPQMQPPATGHEAGMATIHLMSRTAKRIPPKKLVESYVAAGGAKRVAVYTALWNEYADDTAACMWDGAKVLAALWDGAWLAGSGNKIATKELKARSLTKLKKLYQNPKFLESLDLDAIGEVLSEP